MRNHCGDYSFSKSNNLYKMDHHFFGIIICIIGISSIVGYIRSEPAASALKQGLAKGGGEIPWYVFEVPVIVIGCETPTMLADIPQARTYINIYDTKETTIEILVFI